MAMAAKPERRPVHRLCWLLGLLLLHGGGAVPVRIGDPDTSAAGFTFTEEEALAALEALQSGFGPGASALELEAMLGEETEALLEGDAMLEIDQAADEFFAGEADRFAAWLQTDEADAVGRAGTADTEGPAEEEVLAEARAAAAAAAAAAAEEDEDAAVADELPTDEAAAVADGSLVDILLDFEYPANVSQEHLSRLFTARAAAFVQSGAAAGAGKGIFEAAITDTVKRSADTYFERLWDPYIAKLPGIEKLRGVFGGGKDKKEVNLKVANAMVKGVAKLVPFIKKLKPIYQCMERLSDKRYHLNDMIKVFEKGRNTVQKVSDYVWEEYGYNGARAAFSIGFANVAKDLEKMSRMVSGPELFSAADISQGTGTWQEPFIDKAYAMYKDMSAGMGGPLTCANQKLVPDLYNKLKAVVLDLVKSSLKVSKDMFDSFVRKAVTWTSRRAVAFVEKEWRMRRLLSDSVKSVAAKLCTDKVTRMAGDLNIYYKRLAQRKASCAEYMRLVRLLRHSYMPLTEKLLQDDSREPSMPTPKDRWQGALKSDLGGCYKDFKAWTNSVNSTDAGVLEGSGAGVLLQGDRSAPSADVAEASDQQADEDGDAPGMRRLRLGGFRVQSSSDSSPPSPPLPAGSAGPLKRPTWATRVRLALERMNLVATFALKKFTSILKGKITELIVRPIKDMLQDIILMAFHTVSHASFAAMTWLPSLGALLMTPVMVIQSFAHQMLTTKFSEIGTSLVELIFFSIDKGAESLAADAIKKMGGLAASSSNEPMQVIVKHVHEGSMSETNDVLRGFWLPIPDLLYAFKPLVETMVLMTQQAVPRLKASFDQCDQMCNSLADALELTQPPKGASA